MEGAIRQRIEREFKIKPDGLIGYAGLLYDKNTRKALEKLYRQHLQIAQDFSIPIMLLTNTRRVNKERIKQSTFHHQPIISDYITFLKELATGYTIPVFIGGMTGCKNDAYKGNEGLSTSEAIDFQKWQMDEFQRNLPDFMFAAIMPALAETIGMAQLVDKLPIPYIISLMIHRKGTLLDDTYIHDAIHTIDKETTRKPLCYITNCVHSAILQEALAHPINKTRLVRERFAGIQANASNMEADQLDSCDLLQSTAASDLAAAFINLHQEFPIKVAGGCCRTDHTHIIEIAKIFRNTSPAV